MNKTVSVEALKVKVNKMILDLPDTNTAAREALQTLIENVLMDSGNYHGFQYLDKRSMEQSAKGTTVGINDVTPADVRTYIDSRDPATVDPRFDNTDHTRVKYF